MSTCAGAVQQLIGGVLGFTPGGGARLQGLGDACVGCEERMGTCHAHRMREES